MLTVVSKAVSVRAFFSTCFTIGEIYYDYSIFIEYLNQLLIDYLSMQIFMIYLINLKCSSNNQIDYKIKQMWTPAKKQNTNSSFNRRDMTTAPRTNINSNRSTNDHRDSHKSNTYVKTQQRVFLLPHLQDIYAQLNFNNNFQTFSEEELMVTKTKLDQIARKIKNDDDSRCLIHQKQALNLYCEKDKQLLCILCVHRDNLHKDKSHNVVPVSSVEPLIKTQIGRLKDKIENMIYKLTDWENKLKQKMQQLGSVCARISNITEELFNSIREEITMNQKSFAKTLMQNQLRATKVMELYYQKIESINTSYMKHVSDAKQLNLVDQMNLLKVVGEELDISQKLIRKAYDMLTVFPIWAQIQDSLEKLQKKHNSETKTLNQRMILVTEF